MKIFKITIFAFAMVIILSQCNTKKSPSELETLKLSFQALNDSIATAWEIMIKDDDEKLFHLKRLVDEVTYTEQFDQEEVNNLYQRIEKMKSLRYNQETMVDSELIDEYDLAIANLINEVTTLASSHPKFENYPLMEELINDIREADNRVLFHRVNYDDFAKEYNALIEENAKILIEIDSSGKFEKKPLFELIQ